MRVVCMQARRTRSALRVLVRRWCSAFETYFASSSRRRVLGCKKNTHLKSRCVVPDLSVLLDLQDFEDAESLTPVQTLELDPASLNDTPVELRYVKFQNVSNLIVSHP